MRIASRRAIGCLIGLAGALIVSTLPSTEASASVVQKSTAVTTTSTTKVPVSAARCARLKVQYPSHVHDSSLCQATHIETRTLTLPTSQKAPQACGPGYIMVGYTDEYIEFPGVYATQMNSTFKYSCGVPVDVHMDACYVVYATAGHSISDFKCWGYGTDLPSRAAFEQWTVNMPLGAGSYTAWQRRECYKVNNDSSTSCHWYWG